MSQHKEPPRTKRGQFHRYRSFWFVLLSDPNIDKVDSNTRQKHKDKFDKKQISLEKRNKDPEYFRQIIIQSYPLLADNGGQFTLWQVHESKTNLEPLPADVNNAEALCDYEGIKRSCVYIRPQLYSVNKTEQLVSSTEYEVAPLNLHTGMAAESHGPFMQLLSEGTLVVRPWTSNTDMTMVPAADGSLRPGELMMSGVSLAKSGSVMPNYPSMNVNDLSAPVQLSNRLSPTGSIETSLTAKRKADVSGHHSIKQQRTTNSDDAEADEAHSEDMTNAMNDQQASQHAEKDDDHCDEDIVKCFMCKQLLVEPKLLPCLDSFCLQCLESFVQRTSQPFLCPVCEAQFEIPPGGVASFPHSSFAEKLVELTKIANKDGTNACCEVCIEEDITGDDISRAVGYCLQCRQKLCSRCMKTHKFLKYTRTHNVVDLGYKTAEEMIRFIKMEAPHCSLHETVLAVTHCHTCNVQICQDCLSHHTGSDHELEDITNSTVQKNVEHCIQELSAAVDKRQSVYMKCDRTLEEAKQSMQNDLSKLEKYKSRLNSMTRIVKFGNELINKGSITDMLFHSKLLQNQIHKYDVNLDELHLSVHTSANKLDSASCAVSNGHNGDTNSEIPDEKIPDYDDESGECRFEELETFTTAKADPCGVTCFFNNVYFIHRSSDVITVHQQNDYSSKGEIHVSDLKSACDIVSCEKNSCLYVSDKDNKCIWQVSVNDNNRVDRLLCSISDPYTLSVTSGGRLLMANRTKHCLDLYQPMDNSLQQIQLPEYMEQLTHAVETADGNYIITLDGPELCCVCLVTNSGQVLRSYGSSPGCERGHLESPAYLSLDPVGNVFVIDLRLDLLLLLFDSQLQLQCTMASWSFSRMCYSKLTRHLITVHSHKHQCHVWKVSPSQQVSSMESCYAEELSERNVFSRSYLYDCGESQVSGVVCLMNRIFIANDEAIEIYLTHFPFTRSNTISISRLKAPKDMAACSKNNCLYVVDGKKQCVWRVKYDQEICKLIRNIRIPYKLSVTSGGQLLIVNGLHGRLELYSDNGEVDRHVLLPDHIVEPQHAVMSLKHTLIVSYGCKYEDHGVCELSLVGTLLNTYSGNVKCPVYLSLDADGQVFLADCRNQRVLVLDSQLKLKRKLLHDDDDYYNFTFRVCVVHDVPLMITARLLCGEQTTFEVNLFCIGKPKLMPSTTTDCLWDGLKFDHLISDDDTDSETADDGESEADDDSDEKGLDKFVNCKCLKLSTLNTLTRPTGVTCMFDLLFITCEKSDVIHVVQCGLECTILEQITVSGLKSARDIVSCEKNSCLYVSDKGNKCIWQVSVSDNNRVDRLQCSISDPYTLSVTSDGRLLMANEEEHCLNLYQPVDGSSQRIQLSEDLSDSLKHAVETVDGNYIVAGDDVGLHLVTCDGVLFRSFCYQPGMDIRSIHYVSVDADDNVLAISHWDDSLLLIDSALTHVTACRRIANGCRFAVMNKLGQVIIVGSSLEIYSICSNSPMTSQCDGAVKVVNHDMRTTSGKNDSRSDGLTFLASVFGTHENKLPGIAVLAGRIFVLTRRSICICEYHHPYRYLDKITKEGLDSFECIAACDTRKCLYVTDSRSKCLWRMKMDHDDGMEMFISNIKPPYRMSVTPDGRILVINGHYHRLDVYEYTGSLCRSVPLPDSITRPQHAVLSSSGTFIVAYGQQDRIYMDSDEDDDDTTLFQKYTDYKHGICELSLDGSLQNSYRGKVSCPQHLSVSSSGELFVADRGNERVLLLDTQLKLKQKLTLRIGLRAEPTAVCYVPLHNRLLVNCHHFSSGSVLMFTVTSTTPVLPNTVQQPHPANAVRCISGSLALPPSTTLNFGSDNFQTPAHPWNIYSKLQVVPPIYNSQTFASGSSAAFLPSFMPTDASWRKTRARFLELKVVEAFPLLSGSELSIPGYDNLLIDTIEPDGNCFFRALSKEVTGVERYHDKIRCSVVNLMVDTRFSSAFASYAGVSSIEYYISGNRIRYLGTWATDVEIFAAASLLRTTIVVYYQGKWVPYRPYVEVPEAPASTDCCIYLTNTGRHFNRISVSTFQTSHGVGFLQL